MSWHDFHKNLLKVASYKFLRNFLLNNTTINEIFVLFRPKNIQ